MRENLEVEYGAEFVILETFLDGSILCRTSEGQSFALNAAQKRKLRDYLNAEVV